MERLARYFDVDADELAVMRGVSEAFHTVLRGLPWEAGDRIVISDNEEAALLLPSLHLRDRLGVEVVKLPLAEDREELMAAGRRGPDAEDAAAGPEPRDHRHGLPLSRRALCALARERGIPSFLDLAHSCGAVPYRLRDLGCDFAGLLSYKWMFSPYAAGALWVRRERLHDIEVTYAGCRAEKWLDFETDTFELPDTAQRFQYGPWSWPLVHAWAAAADWLQEIGPEAVWSRICELTDRLKAGLARIDGAELYTPRSPDDSAALVSFGLRGWTGADLTAALQERWNIVIKPLPHTVEGLRASICFFQLEEEIDLLLEALGELGGEGYCPALGTLRP